MYSSDDTDHHQAGTTIRRVYETVASSPPRARIAPIHHTRNDQRYHLANSQQRAVDDAGTRHRSSLRSSCAPPERSNLLSPPPLKPLPSSSRSSGHELRQPEEAVLSDPLSEDVYEIRRSAHSNNYRDGGLGVGNGTSGYGRGIPYQHHQAAAPRGTHTINSGLRYKTRSYASSATTTDTETSTDMGIGNSVAGGHHQVHVASASRTITPPRAVAVPPANTRRLSSPAREEYADVLAAPKVVRTRSPAVSSLNPAGVERPAVHVRRTLPVESPRKQPDTPGRDSDGRRHEFVVVRGTSAPAPLDVRQSGSPALIARSRPSHSAEWRSPLPAEGGAPGGPQHRYVRVDDDEFGYRTSSSSSSTSSKTFAPRKAGEPHEFVPSQTTHQHHRQTSDGGVRNVRYVSPSHNQPRDQPRDQRRGGGDRWAPQDWKPSDGEGHAAARSTSGDDRGRLLSPSVRGGLQNAKFAVTPAAEVRHRSRYDD